MDALAIVLLQLVLSLAVFSIIAKWYVTPWLSRREPVDAIALLILPHTLRHVGMAFLVPGLVAADLPRSFAFTTAYGDLVSGLLAIFAVLAIRRSAAFSIPLVWLFNVVGSVDLLWALSHADAVPHLVTTWYIPTFWVPVLLVTHALIFARLYQHATQSSDGVLQEPVFVRVTRT